MKREFDLTYRGVVHSKKNSKQIIKDPIGRPRIISNAKSREMEREMVSQFHDQMPLQGLAAEIWMTQTERILACKEHARTYSVSVTVYEPNNIRRDLDNQITSILDGLVSAGALPDDCANIVTNLSVKYGGIDRVNPRAEIHIEEESV